MDKRSKEQKMELDYHFDRLDKEGRKILLLFARKIENKKGRINRP